MLFRICLLLLCLTGCTFQETAQKEELPRPAPGYLHWMQKQSMLGQAPELIAQVSQTQRVWLQSGEPRRASVLLRAAPNWLELTGVGNSTSSPVFRTLASQVAKAPTMGFGGIYLGETGEKPDIWTSKDGRVASQKAASFMFDASFGTDEDFQKLTDAAEAAGLELGSDLLAGATGRGPDFFLQARNAPAHGGLYALLPVPEESIPLLPLTREEWDSEALPPATVATLAESGVLPNAIARDKLIWASKGGWAATGPVMGSDGVPRRWLYRFSENPSQPVLSWQDPSGQTARVLHAAAIRHTGLLGEALAGLHFEPMMALEAGDTQDPALSPGMAALNEMARQIHRYGGWAMQADPLPLSAMTEVLKGPCDFCRDDITPLLVAFGLLMADGRPVAQLYRDWISSNLDVSRLARGYNASNGLNPNLLLANPAWTEQGQKLAESGSSFRIGHIASQIFPNPTEADAEKLRRFLLVWRLGMPGLAFVEFAPGSLENSPGQWLEQTLRARRASGLATGRVISVIRGHGGGFGLLSKLPDGAYWLLACNFGRNRDELNISLPTPVRQAIDAGSGENLNMHGQIFRIGLDGREARNVLFTAAAPKPENAGVTP